MHNNDGTGEILTYNEQARLGLIQINHLTPGNYLSTQSYNQLVGQMYDWVEDPEIYAVIIESTSHDCFSLGSDPSEFLLAYENDKNAALTHFKQQYEALWRIECFTKPFIVMVNGPVASTAAALSQYGTHLIAGENFSWSLPEIKSGFFPAAGIRRILAGMPHAIGTYLALTGRSIDRADAFFLGLIEHCIDSSNFDDIKRRVADADPIDPIFDGLHRDPPPGKLEKLAETISSTFSGKSVEEIIETLENETGEHREWALETANELQNLSPLSLKVTLASLQNANTLSADQNLEADFLIASHFLDADDYATALRATQSDHSRPNWSPNSLAKATPEIVNRYFTSCSQKPLMLPPRELGVDK